MSVAYSGVYVFGDSLVDAGNALKLAQTYDYFPFTDLPSGAPTADKGYYKGRFTDGYTFADLLSNKFVGMPTKPVFPFGYDDPYLGISFGFFSDPSGKNLNFAYGGGQIRQGDEAVPDMDDQTDAFRDAVDGHADPNALHLFVFGANDVHDLVPKSAPWVDEATAIAILTDAADEWVEEINDVIAMGGKNVLALGVPDIGIQPYYNGSPDEAQRRAVATHYAELLDGLIRDRLGQINSPNFHFVGFTEMAGSVLGEMAQLYPGGVYPLNTSSLVFFDAVHPTAQLHAMAAAYMLDSLNGTSAGEAFPLATPNMKLSGTISAVGEVDKLSFALAANSSYTFEMLGLSSGKLPGLVSSQVLADPKLRIVGPDGSVSVDDDGGVGLDSHLQFTTGAAGTYTLELSGVGSLTGAYTVQAQNQSVHDDVYRVTSASTLVLEGANGGTDQLLSTVSYTLSAGSSIEALAAANAASTASINLIGNELAQSVTGNAGGNLIDGRGGADQLWGLGGADTFYFSSALGAGNVDRIQDYNARHDTIRLDDQVFTALPAGNLAAGAFYTGAAAHDSDDRIIYNPVTHQLFYDPDGNGVQAPVQFAEVYGTNVKLTSADFVVS
ncbi:SGNH/GDSL hydrolase family protein [Sphingomonas hankyongi]|uniref:SGNH/GDSL hydrolase family protein n=1 Tax=Sphingomonas hankyongi TaxID=2908209 RepID=A0ABT0S2B8_9SPHN|nr:SGNH/GDSL hydrolase family protein [Sphingomonas hankyongi]MCL6729993.1 SGNH/GDSL hydrolase family protein [Sphingomonas hankyongi]